MNLQQVARYSDLKEGSLIEVAIGNNKIVLLQHEGKVKAFQGDCPHEGAALAQGHVENGHIVCPLHRRHYSCQTGKHNLSDQCLKTYSVIEKDDLIFINVTALTNDASKKDDRPLRTLDDLPSPKGHLLLGNLPDFQVPDNHLVTKKWIDELGSLFRLSLAGKKILVSADPDVNRQIMKARPEHFARLHKMSDILEEMGVLGTFNAEGKTWERHRKVIAEALNYKNTKAYFSVVVGMTDRLLNRWSGLANMERSIDVQKELMRYTVDITSVIAFGYDTHTLDHDGDIVQQHLEKIFPMLHYRITAPIPYWRFVKMKKDRILDEAIAAIEKTVNQFILAARKRLEGDPSLRDNPTNFLEAMLVEQEKTGNFSDKEVYGNVFTVLLAGEDTTSNSISFALYYLAQHPNVVREIRNELDRICPGKKYPDSFSEVTSLKYIEAVVNEAMRLKPVAPFIYLEALKDTVVNDLELKKGTSILLQNGYALTDSMNFSRPDEFLPERWLAGKCPFTGAHNPEVIHNFGNGPRYCPGKNLAMVEMVAAVAMVCRNFDLTLAVKPDEVREVNAFTVHPGNLLITLKSCIAEAATVDASAHN